MAALSGHEINVIRWRKCFLYLFKIIKTNDVLLIKHRVLFIVLFFHHLIIFGSLLDQCVAGRLCIFKIFSFHVLSFTKIAFYSANLFTQYSLCFMSVYCKKKNETNFVC